MEEDNAESSPRLPREHKASTSSTGSQGAAKLPSDSNMSAKYSYRDLAHPSMENVVRTHNASTLKLLLTVADFAQKVASAHEHFSSQLHSVCNQFKQVSSELKKERPVDCTSSIHSAWESLLHGTEIDAQAQADTASLLIKNVYDPLVEVAQHKKSHCKKLYSFREHYENELEKAQEQVEKSHEDYLETYTRYRSNSRDTTKNLASYFNQHNDYVLRLWASNRINEEYTTTALPYILEELEEIHIDISNVLNGAIESHTLLMVTKANEQCNRFESILKVCKTVNPKGDVGSFIRSVCPEPLEILTPINTFTPPETAIGSEAIMKCEIINDRLTETNLKTKKQELQREAAELTSYIKQNQDVTQTLMNICQRNLANHLYSKVYETQEDLCRKRNEIRLATMQLAAIRIQIELLSPKQNGSVESDRETKKAQTATIKGMWKKAFRSLKKKDIGEDKGDTKYSKLSTRRSFLKRRDSKDQTPEDVPVERKLSEEIDPVYSLLKCAADLPKGGKHCHSTCTGTSPKSRCTHHAHANIAASVTSESLNVKSQGSSRSSSPSSAIDFVAPPQPEIEAVARPQKQYVKRQMSAPGSAVPKTDFEDKAAPSSPTTRRRRFTKRATSLEVGSAEDRFQASQMRFSPHHSPQNLSPKSQRRYVPGNLYVALYNFKGKEKDDLDLRAGWRVSAIDTSDPDWWRGNCNGKVGYFPASYVQKLHQGERVLIVTHSLQLSEGENGVKLLRDQIVIRTGPEDQGMVPIKVGKKELSCPSKYLMEV